MDHDLTLLDLTADGQRCLVMRDSNESYLTAAAQFPTYAQVYNTDTWQPASGRMAPASGYVWTARFTPDGSRVVMGNGEVWNAVSGERLVGARVTHRNAHRLVIADDGDSFLTVCNFDDPVRDETTEIRFFSIDGQPLASPIATTGTRNGVYSLHPDGEVLAVIGTGVRFWDPRRALALSGVIDLHSTRIDDRNQTEDRATFFSPDGHRLYIEDARELLVLDWRHLNDSIPSDEVLDAWSGILSGHRIDEAGGAVPLTPEELQHCWQVVQFQ
jgi:hypothetical protein